MEDISLLKQALPYIKQYRNKTFVIKFGGDVVSDRGRLESLAEDVSLLHELNIRIVIIHGGGPQATKLAEQLGIHSEKIEGRRVTDDRMLEVTKMVFAGQISTDILAALRKFGTPAIGMSGVDGDLIDAVRRPPRRVFDERTGEVREVDFQNVGDIRAVRPQVLRVLLENRFVPVVASLGADEQGRVLNINADTIAAEIAANLPAEKLFIFSNVPGILRDPADPASKYSYLTVEEVEELVRSGVVSGGMSVKVAAAVLAVKKGVPRVHIVNGLDQNVLLYEVFTRRGLGTMVLSKEEAELYVRTG